MCKLRLIRRNTDWRTYRVVRRTRKLSSMLSFQDNVQTYTREQACWSTKGHCWDSYCPDHSCNLFWDFASPKPKCFSCHPFWQNDCPLFNILPLLTHLWISISHGWACAQLGDESSGFYWIKNMSILGTGQAAFIRLNFPIIALMFIYGVKSNFDWTLSKRSKVTINNNGTNQHPVIPDICWEGHNIICGSPGQKKKKKSTAWIKSLGNARWTQTFYKTTDLHSFKNVQVMGHLGDSEG